MKPGNSTLGKFRPGVRVWGSIAAIVAALLLAIAGDTRSRTIFDLYQTIYPRPVAATDVVVVVIDDAAVAAVESWPWPRHAFARLVEGIAHSRPAVIGISVIFAEPDRNSPANFTRIYPELKPDTARELQALPAMDALLAEVVRETTTVLAMGGIDGIPERPTNPDGSVVFAPALPGSVSQYSGSIRSIAVIRDEAQGEGLVNASPDTDGLVRKVPVAAYASGSGRASLPLEMMRQAFGGKPVRTLASGNDLTGLEIGRLKIPITPDGAARLWYGKLPSSSYYSALSFLGNKPAQLGAGKYVLVGITASGVSDIATVPHLGQIYGVDVQAQALDSMLKGQLLRRPAWTEYVEWCLAIGLTLAVLLLFDRVSIFSAVALPLLGVVLVAGISFSAFRFSQILIDPVLPLGVAGSALTAIGLVRFMQVAREKQEIHRAFDRYLSPELVARIAKDPSQLELGGEERDVTVLFCDVRGSSAISEQLTPNQMIQFLIGLLTPMTDILLAGHATIDKYVGDAVIAFWNAPLNDPRHAQNAADVALEMSRRLVELNRDMPHQSRYPWPGEVRIGIGMNSGLACVGNMGSERRLNYSMIGDTVNLASRIEGLTKFYGVEIAIGEDLARRIEDYAIFEMDRVKVVGRERPETVWALVGDPEQAKAPDFVTFKDLFGDLLEQYRSKHWDDARSVLRQLSETSFSVRFGKLLSIFGDRVASLEDQALPDDWDGVFIARQK